MRFINFFRLLRKISFFLKKLRERNICFEFVRKRTQVEKKCHPKTCRESPVSWCWRKMSTSNEKKEKRQVAGFNAATCGLAFWSNFSTRRNHSLANSKEKTPVVTGKNFENRHESILFAQKGKLEVCQFWNKEPKKSFASNQKPT